MADQEIRTPQRQLDNLDNELSCGLRHGMVSETSSVPLASPPRQVGLIVLELSREEDSDEDLVNGTLNVDDGDQPKNSMGDIPQLQEPLYNSVSDRRAKNMTRDLPRIRRTQSFQVHPMNEQRTP